MNKLVIWDFDGVVADTEKLWVELWSSYIENKFGVKQTYDEWYKIIPGIGDEEKVKLLNEKFGIEMTDDDVEALKASSADRLRQGLELTSGIANIFACTKNQCIATGADLDETLLKMKVLKLEKYFTEANIFTRDMVLKGKPDPDIFLLAAGKMGFDVANCVVVDDAIAGAKAAKAAGIDVVSFVEHHGTSQGHIVDKVKAIGVDKIAYNMEDVKSFI